MNEQANFWAGNFGEKYRLNNTNFQESILIDGWNKILLKVNKSEVFSFLECGSNIGRNIHALKMIIPNARPSLVEVNKESFQIAVDTYSPVNSFNGQILDSKFENEKFDLVFSCGVLIHIAPYDLYRNLLKMYDYSKKYIVICEYFSRRFETILYHGETNKLFKMDYGSYFMENFNAKIIDYGFLWGRLYDNGGFDDMTYWLFEKSK